MKYAILLLVLLLAFMPLQNWEGLQKSATDPETIEEAIDRLIGVHESDASAHLGAGESLEAHKNSDIIDHPPFSVVPDKYSNEWLDFVSVFPSLDSWVMSGLNTLEFPGAIIQATSPSDRWAFMNNGSGALGSKSVFIQETLFEELVVFYDLNSSVGYMFGLASSGYSPSTVYSGNGMYFRVVSNALYARVKSSSETLDFEITGIDLTEVHWYRMHYTPATDTIQVYVDGVLVHTFAKPSGSEPLGINYYHMIGGASGTWDTSVLFLQLRFSILLL